MVTDPYDPSLGLNLPKLSADIVTVSHHHKDHDYLRAVAGTTRREHPFLIDSPGEYEISGVSVFGIRTFHDARQGSERGVNTVFVVHIDELSVAHLGDLGHPLSETQLEEIGDVDVALVPVGGVYTLNPARALEVIRQLTPSIVVPMHFRSEKHDPQRFGKLVPVDDFLQEGGFEQAQRVDKLSLTKTALPEETEVVVLTV